MTTFQTDHCFFFRFDLQRNHHIRSVALVEESSILLPPRCLEASGWQFLKLVHYHYHLNSDDYYYYYYNYYNYYYYITLPSFDL